jgi:hypothetical protein
MASINSALFISQFLLDALHIGAQVNEMTVNVADKLVGDFLPKRRPCYARLAGASTALPSGDSQVLDNRVPLSTGYDKG